MAWLRVAKGVDWDQVRAVAEQVRGGAMDSQFSDEQYGASRFKGGKAYPPRFYEGEAYPDQPTQDQGACDQMSELLCDKLYEIGYRARTVYGRFFVSGGRGVPGEDTTVEGHVWVELDGKIIDLTADQFNAALVERGEEPMPKVYIGPKSDSRYQEEY